MPSLTFQKISPGRSLRKLQTVFNPSDSQQQHDTTSPLSAKARSASVASTIDFRGLDKSLDDSVTNLILGSVDEHGSWVPQPILLPSMSASSASPGSPETQEPWKPVAWSASSPALSSSAPEPRGFRRMIRKKKSKAEMRQIEEKQQVRGDLISMAEPRPSTGVAKGGIEEVLEGDA